MKHSIRLLKEELNQTRANHAAIIKRQRLESANAHEDDRWSWQDQREQLWIKIEEMENELSKLLSL